MRQMASSRKDSFACGPRIGPWNARDPNRALPRARFALRLSPALLFTRCTR